MAEVGQTIIVDKIPLVLYWDSIRALNRDRTQSGSWSIRGHHRIANKIVRGGQTVYAIYNNTGAYVIGWIRAEDVTDPTLLPEPDPELPPEPEVIPPDMVVEINGETYDLFDGSNKIAGLKLNAGVNRIKITGNGIIRFHYRDEVMG